LVVPNISQLKELLEEAHCFKYIVHPGTMKMHNNLTKFLLKEYEERCGKVCRQLLHLSASVQETSRYSATFTYSGVEVGANFNEFYCGSTQNKKV